LAQAQYDAAQGYRDQATNLRDRANQNLTDSTNLQNQANDNLAQAEAIMADCLTIGD
jgi:hypothetical protein